VGLGQGGRQQAGVAGSRGSPRQASGCPFESEGPRYRPLQPPKHPLTSCRGRAPSRPPPARGRRWGQSRGSAAAGPPPRPWGGVGGWGGRGRGETLGLYRTESSLSQRGVAEQGGAAAHYETPGRVVAPHLVAQQRAGDLGEGVAAGVELPQLGRELCRSVGGGSVAALRRPRGSRGPTRAVGWEPCCSRQNERTLATPSAAWAAHRDGV
jgi:hypothetical protein